MGMTGLDPVLEAADNYRRFAQHEAAGRSPAYEHLAYAVAEDGLVLSFLYGLPLPKRQPNLLFGAACYLLGSPPSPASLRALVTERPAELAAVMEARCTQTNEAARCASAPSGAHLVAPAPRPARGGRFSRADPPTPTSTRTIMTATGCVVLTLRRRRCRAGSAAPYRCPTGCPRLYGGQA